MDNIHVLSVMVPALASITNVTLRLTFLPSLIYLCEIMRVALASPFSFQMANSIDSLCKELDKHLKALIPLGGRFRFVPSCPWDLSSLIFPYLQRFLKMHKLYHLKDCMLRAGPLPFSSTSDGERTNKRLKGLFTKHTNMKPSQEIASVPACIPSFIFLSQH